NGDRAHDDVLAGNLCRCTGYAPIIRAAEAAVDLPVPDWMTADRAGLAQLAVTEVPGAFRPETSDELAEWYLANPDAVLVAGATDVGLWVTKQLRDLTPVAFLNGISDLRRIERQGDTLRIGAGVTIADLRAAVQDLHPSFAEMLR